MGSYILIRLLEAKKTTFCLRGLRLKCSSMSESIDFRGQRGLGGNNKGVCHILQSSRTGASPPDSIASYPGHPLVRVSYSSAEMPSVYTTTKADWTFSPKRRKDKQCVMKSLKMVKGLMNNQCVMKSLKWKKNYRSCSVYRYKLLALIFLLLKLSGNYCLWRVAPKFKL